MNLYITPFEYTRAPTGQETASLLGNLLRVGTGGVIVGATTLPVTPNTTVTLAQYDNITIFDGSNSEIVQVTASTSPGAPSIPISATVFAHSAGTPIMSDGASGSLAQAIVEGSAHVERFCEQELLQATYSETLELRTIDACVTNTGSLSIRPLHFPVTALTALSLQADATNTITLDPTQAVFRSKAQLIRVPVVATQGTGPNLMVLKPPLDQQAEGWVNFTYTAGYLYNALPWDIKQAATLLSSNVLADRFNRSGAAQVRLGAQQIDAYLRGDVTAESALVKRAYSLLEQYRREA